MARAVAADAVKQPSIVHPSVPPCRSWPAATAPPPASTMSTPAAVERAPVARTGASHHGSGRCSSGESSRNSRDHDDREHDRPKREQRPKARCVNVIRVEADRVQGERGDRDRRDVPEVQRHRSPVADRDDVPDPRSLRPIAGSRPAAATNSARHPGAVQREQQRRRRDVGHLLGPGDDERDLVRSGQRPARSARRTRTAATASAARGPIRPARVGHADHDRDQPDDDEVRDARHRECRRRAGSPSITAAAASRDADDHRDVPARRQPGQGRDEGQHDEVDAEEPQQCDASRGRGPPRIPRRGSGAATRRPTAHAARYQKTGRHSRCARVNSHVPHDVPCAPAVRARGAAGEEEQRHDLHDPRDRGDRGQLAEQVADPQTPPASMVASSSAQWPNITTTSAAEPGDVDGAVAGRRGVGGEFIGAGHGLGERHGFRMPWEVVGRLSSTT